MSGCSDSVVCVWDVETGQKVMQFSQVHGDAEITAMAFDPTERRLVTAGRDGTVKTWNFNNGACLGELDSPDICEVIRANGETLIFSCNFLVTIDYINCLSS